MKTPTKEISARLEYLRGEIQAERISYGEIAELQSLAEYIEPGDVELLRWAGVDENNQNNQNYMQKLTEQEKRRKREQKTMSKQKIQLIEVGYFHPSQANWSYHIFMVIDQKGARFYKSTFGGEYRMIENMKKQGREVEQLSAGIGSDSLFAGRKVARMIDIENYNGCNWGEKSFDNN